MVDLSAATSLADELDWADNIQTEIETLFNTLRTYIQIESIFTVPSNGDWSAATVDLRTAMSLAAEAFTSSEGDDCVFKAFHIQSYTH